MSWLSSLQFGSQPWLQLWDISLSATIVNDLRRIQASGGDEVMEQILTGYSKCRISTPRKENQSNPYPIVYL
jgi:hypothetical protein